MLVEGKNIEIKTQNGKKREEGKIEGLLQKHQSSHKDKKNRNKITKKKSQKKRTGVLPGKIPEKERSHRGTGNRSKDGRQEYQKQHS